MSSDQTNSNQQASLFEVDAPEWEIDAAEDGLVATVEFSEAPYGPYDYLIPQQLANQVFPGMRLNVPLGKRRQPVIGWCTKVGGATDTPRGRLRHIGSCYDQRPLCDRKLVELVQWISHYYQARTAQVFDALVPAGVRAGAGERTVTHFHPDEAAFDVESIASLPNKQKAVMELLLDASSGLTMEQILSQIQCTAAPVRSLCKKQFIKTTSRRVLNVTAQQNVAPTSLQNQALCLTSEQQHSLDRICGILDSGSHATVLLHGVTGSGKTEVYIRAIEHLQRFGRQAIVLVPEISLTPQTRQRFQDRFQSVAVLHSQMSPVERNQHWQRIAEGSVQVIVGPRSAVFAPAPHLGLIVIDEEHDGSFKQDTIPRYHARDVARFRAQQHGIPLVLGSATPSLESWNASKKGTYQLVELKKRVGDQALPHVQLVDLRLREERRGGSISRQLQQAIQQTLDERGQVILLLNRRGFATSIQCPSCGHVVGCPNCEMPLTHHRDGGKAVCHYCDYQIATPPWCPECQFDGIHYSGLGTQRLEAEVKTRFPSAQVARMDSDTMRKPGSHERVLSAFRAGELQILLGTQMIAKGLDFPNVMLVGVINADSALHFPDFRAAERTFQLVTQVAGRAGRSERGGNVIVQTFSPEHAAIRFASTHDYNAFAQEELKQREKFGYPPFGRIARIIIRGEKESEVEAFSESIVRKLESTRAEMDATVRILGPAPPPISKLRGKYRFHILLQCQDSQQLGRLIRNATGEFKSTEEIQFVIDIDPVDLL